MGFCSNSSFSLNICNFYTKTGANLKLAFACSINVSLLSYRRLVWSILLWNVLGHACFHQRANIHQLGQTIHSFSWSIGQSGGFPLPSVQSPNSSRHQRGHHLGRVGQTVPFNWCAPFGGQSLRVSDRAVENVPRWADPGADFGDVGGGTVSRGRKSKLTLIDWLTTRCRLTNRKLNTAESLKFVLFWIRLRYLSRNDTCGYLPQEGLMSMFFQGSMGISKYKVSNCHICSHWGIFIWRHSF